MPAPTRRSVLALGLAAPLTLRLRPAGATPAEMQAAIDAFTGGAETREGGMSLTLPPLVEDGNAVPLTVSAESPMTVDDHVSAIAVFNERNPLPEVVTFHFSPWTGRAEVQTRIRLFASQSIHAVARISGGRYRRAAAHVVVTVPACSDA